MLLGEGLPFGEAVEPSFLSEGKDRGILPMFIGAGRFTSLGDWLPETLDESKALLSTATLILSD